MSITPNPYGGVWVGGLPSTKNLWAALVKVGAHHARYQCFWYDLETSPGVYNWSNVDDLVQTAQSNKMLLTFPIQSAPTFSTVPLFGTNQTIPDPNKIGAFCDKLLARYPPGTFYSIEVNNEGYSSGSPQPQQFQLHLLPSLQAVSASTAAPSPPRLLGGPAELNNDTSVVTTWWQMFYQAGCHSLCDYLNIHWYGGDPDHPNAGKTSWLDRINIVKATSAAHGDAARPIWITEFGWVLLKVGLNSGIPDATLASYLKTCLTEAMNSSSVQRVFYFNLGSLAPGFGANQNFTLQSFTTFKDFITANPQWSGTAGPPPPPNPPPPPPPGSGAPNVLYLLMENRPYSGVIGTSGRAVNWPHTNALATTYAKATACYSEGHPSLPNYLSLISGSKHGVTTDGSPSQVGGPFGGSTLVDELTAAGITWKAYFESTPPYATGYTGGNTGTLQTGYCQHHNPFVYFSSITGSTAKLNNLVDYSNLFTDLNSTTPPSFVFVCPTKAHQGHDDTTAEDTAGDNFLNSFISAVQATSWYANNGQILVVWDESADTDTAGIGDASPGGGHMPVLVISNFAKSLGDLTTSLNHFGILRGLCKLYNVALLGNAAHTTNGDITPLLNPASGGGGGGGTITATPTSLSFSAVAGGSSPATQTLVLTNSDTGSVTASTAITYGTSQPTGWLSSTPTTPTIAGAGTVTITATVTLGTLAAGTYNATLFFTTATVQITVNVTLVVSTSTGGGGGPPPPPPTTLTTYLTNGPTPSSPLMNPMLANVASGSALASHTQTIGTKTGYGEINTGATVWPQASGLGTPSGNGWLLDNTLLEGRSIQAGNWTPTMRLHTSVNTIVADLYLRLWVWNVTTNTFTAIGSPLLLAAQTVAQAAANYTWAATALPSPSFGTGDKLYCDLWGNITTNSTGSTSATLSTVLADHLTGTGSVDAQIVTPGYGAAGDHGGPPPPVFLTLYGTNGADTTLPSACDLVQGG